MADLHGADCSRADDQHLRVAQRSTRTGTEKKSPFRRPQSATSPPVSSAPGQVVDKGRLQTGSVLHLRPQSTCDLITLLQV
ncbi:hypothetical protein ACOMHN_012570 [Nucella lapillus]